MFPIFPISIRELRAWFLGPAKILSSQNNAAPPESQAPEPKVVKLPTHLQKPFEGLAQCSSAPPTEAALLALSQGLVSVFCGAGMDIYTYIYEYMYRCGSGFRLEGLFRACTPVGHGATGWQVLQCRVVSSFSAEGSPSFLTRELGLKSSTSCLPLPKELS